jgi:hypothetical protein
MVDSLQLQLRALEVMNMMIDSLLLKLETHLKPFKIQVTMVDSSLSKFETHYFWETQVTMVDSLIIRTQNPKTLANPKLDVPSLPSLELTKQHKHPKF